MPTCGGRATIRTVPKPGTRASGNQLMLVAHCMRDTRSTEPRGLAHPWGGPLACTRAPTRAQTTRWSTPQASPQLQQYMLCFVSAIGDRHTRLLLVAMCGLARTRFLGRAHTQSRGAVGHLLDIRAAEGGANRQATATEASGHKHARLRRLRNLLLSLEGLHFRTGFSKYR